MIYGQDLTKRAPLLPLRKPGERMYRSAARAPLALKYQEPPRGTRDEPLGGAVGSVSAPPDFVRWASTPRG